MKYVIFYPGQGYDDSDAFVPAEASSKEEIIENIKTRISDQKEQNVKYYEYENAFRFSLGDRPSKPKFGRLTEWKNDREKREVQAALKEHHELLAEYERVEKLFEEEHKEYMSKCPYSYSYSGGEVPELENIFEYPDEFWDKHLNGVRY